MPYPQLRLSPAAGRTIGVALIGGLYVAHVALFGDYIADDAGISLAYGRNMVAGYGPVLYPGGEAVEAYSNPLWTALLGAGAATGLDGQDGIPLLLSGSRRSRLRSCSTTPICPRSPAGRSSPTAGP